MDTTHTVALPAVRGGTPIGFMAAVGALQLLAPHGARLSWEDDSPDPRALITGPWTTVEDIITVLAAVVRSVPAGEVIPGVAGWPPPGVQRAGSDAAVVIGEDGWLAVPADPLTEDWVTAVVTIHGRRSPYVMRSRRMSIRSFFGSPLELLRAEPTLALTQGLVQCRRVHGCTAELLDSQAWFTPADFNDNRPPMYGNPALTWLATMSLRVLRTAPPPFEVDTWPGVAVCWHPVEGGNAQMAYPLWRQPMDLPMVRALLGLQALSPRPEPHIPTWEVDLARLAPYSVFLVRGGHWARMDKYTSVLTPGPHPALALRLTATLAAQRLDVDVQHWWRIAPPPDEVLPEGGRIWLSTTVDATARVTRQRERTT
jgi:hypothetical protein